ncbi:MAG: hypothetical protein ACREDG_00150 [Methylocella sp.]
MSSDLVPIGEIERMAAFVVKSNLFGLKTIDQAIALMLLANAEGLHPATAALDYDIIAGRPTKKARAMLRDFLRNDGKVKWHRRDDQFASATFSHPAGGSVEIIWDLARAATAGLAGKEMWKKYPRQMLHARAVSEGVQATFPGATGGMYTPEEQADIPERPMRDVTPTKAAVVDSVKKAVADKAAPPTVEMKVIDDPPHDLDTGEVVESVDDEPIDCAELLTASKATLDRCQTMAAVRTTWDAVLVKDRATLHGREPALYRELVAHMRERAAALKDKP